MLARVSCGVVQAHSQLSRAGGPKVSRSIQSGASGNNPDNGSRVSRDFGDFEPVRVGLRGFDHFEVRIRCSQKDAS